MKLLTRASLILALLIGISGKTYSQYKKITIAANFTRTDNDSLILSKEYQIDFNDNTSFIGVSAFEITNDAEQKGYYYRVSSSDTWSQWIAFKKTEENKSKSRISYEAPAITEQSEFIQFASRNKSTINFRLFNASNNSFQNKDDVNSSYLEDCNCPLPTYCNRDCWCPSGDCEPVQSPAPTDVTHVIVHHSAGFTTSSNFAGVVAYYYDLHVNTNGWDDIGYNWLVDPNGVIYEGRGSGVQGAHFSCMNPGTTGICMIGNYSNEEPTTIAMNSLKDLIAWELCDKETTNPLAIQYHEASELDLLTVSAHRDGNTASSPSSCASGTECPGNILYNLLDDTRQSIAEYECLDQLSNLHTENSIDRFHLYPNPFNDYLYIKNTKHLSNSDNLNLQISDLYSRTVLIAKENIILNQSNSTIRINLTNLPEGVYFIHINSTNSNKIFNSISYKIIKN